MKHTPRTTHKKTLPALAVTFAVLIPVVLLAVPLQLACCAIGSGCEMALAAPMSECEMAGDSVSAADCCSGDADLTSPSAPSVTARLDAPAVRVLAIQAALEASPQCRALTAAQRLSRAPAMPSDVRPETLLL